MGFRLGHNGKRGNGFLEASSSSALKCMNTYGSIDQPDTKHSYPPNHENHENHTNQTNSATTMLSPSTNPTTPPQKSASPSSPLSTLPPHQPPPPSTTPTCPPSPNPKTQPNQTFSHPLPHAITKTLSLPPPLTPAGIPNPAHSILKDNSSANHSFASPRRRFHRTFDFPGLSGVRGGGFGCTVDLLLKVGGKGWWRKCLGRCLSRGIENGLCKRGGNKWDLVAGWVGGDGGFFFRARYGALVREGGFVAGGGVGVLWCGGGCGFCGCGWW